MILAAHNPRYRFNVRPEQPTDSIVVREIWCENVYEVFDGDLSDTHIVVDIGANIGAFSVYAASLHPEAKVYAFEPQPDNLQLLKDNISLNDLVKQITVIPQAVGSSVGTAYITNEGGGSYITTDSNNSVVETTTLEKFWADNKLEYIDILKVDIEGFEYEALLPTPKNLINLCRYIVVEFDNHAEVGKFGELVTKLAETHQLKIVGSETTGGYIYGHRY